MTCAPRRRGFALVLVTLFALLIMSIWSVVYRDLSTLLRIQAAQEARIDPQAETLTVVGSALNLLATQNNTPQAEYTCQINQKMVTFTLVENGVWTVRITDLPPGTSPPSMPAVFP